MFHSRKAILCGLVILCLLFLPLTNQTQLDRIEDKLNELHRKLESIKNLLENANKESPTRRVNNRMGSSLVNAMKII